VRLLLAHRDRLSLNQITTPRWNVSEAVHGCLRHNIPSIALWRHKIADAGLAESLRCVGEAGLRVTSLCRGEMFSASTAQERKALIDDNCRAVDEAAALGANALVMVVGGASPVSIVDARHMVSDGIAALVSYAHDAGVRIGLEPLHPMFAADRSVLATIDEALKIASNYPNTQVGVVLDVFHICWDHNVFEQIARASGGILEFHVSDWLVPLPDILLGRGIMGDGIIDIRSLRAAVDQAGYHGSIEVEIFNQTTWDSDPDEVVGHIAQRFEELV
jgi:sugar phosphate isomerase/epimerase